MTDKIKKPKQKLELTWIGKDKRPRLEPRILLPDDEHFYYADKRSPDGDCFDNKLIYGDNLLVLKSLEQDYSGKVKCVFIDPPYNTGGKFGHYDDGLEHSRWLRMMRDRLELLRTLLAEDGSLWITIDDNESHYLKVMCDEIFGRNNFVNNIVWNHRKSVQNDIVISLSHNHVLVFAKNKDKLQLNRLSIDESKYTNPDNDPRGPWSATPFDAPNIRPNLTYPIKNPNTEEEYLPPEGRHWRTTQDEYLRLLNDKRIVFGKRGVSKPQQKRFLTDAQKKGSSVKTWWDDEGTATEASQHLKKINIDFDTPKPEKLLQKIINIATNKGDLVLDSFAGSGTTGAVAHKMCRKWIMVELGKHCHTHIFSRMKQVVDGTDDGGITQSVGWKGGGGFRAYTLAPSMLKKDDWGYWIINKEVYNPERLAEAMCKHMGFKYAPDGTHYWMHGRGHENAYIYVTTQTMVAEQLHVLNEEVGEGRSLLVCCSAFMGADDVYKNLTIKKIPESVLKNCEWGCDSYSLGIQDLPIAEADLKTDLFNEEEKNNG